MPDFGGDIDLAALSAATPEKLAWEYPGATDVVELYGQRVGSGPALILEDLFSTDTRAAYSQEGQTLNYPGTGVLTVTTGGQNGTTYWRPELAASDAARVKTKGSVGSSAGADGIRAGFKNPATGRDMMAWVLQNGNVYIYYENIVGGSTTNREALGAVLSPLTLNHPYWIELTRAGNNRTVKIYDTDGVTVLYSNTGAIPAPVQAEFGVGTSRVPAFGVDRDSAGGPAQIDQWEFWDTAAETRDLMIAVTSPTSGTRTAKRLLGALGSAGIRSDFALLAGNGGLQLPTFTVATRPPAATYGGSTIYVSDAAAGSRFQYSDGTNWLLLADLASPTFTGSPAAPTQAAADASTKLATTAYADRLAQQVFAINTQTGTAYTAVLADAGKVIESNNAGAMTITIPPNSSVAYPIGTKLRGIRLGAGTLTIVQGAGVVLRNRIQPAGTTNRTVSAQYGWWEMYKRATDEWVLTGDIA